MIADSLSHFGIRDPDQVPVDGACVALMLVLQFSAKHNFLAFSAIIAHFEGINFSSQDSPLGALLAGSGRWAAASRGLTKHLQINQNGDHGNVGLAFADCMAQLSSSTVTDAMRLLELFCSLRELTMSPRMMPAAAS